MIKPLDRAGTWQTYSVANGLPGMRIQHIAEDNEGYIWFATSGSGASRFDGDEFQTFTQQDGLCSNRVFFIHRDHQGRLWFATINGVCWYDGTSFHHLEDDGILGRSVQFLYEDRQGRIWCGGKGTLGYYDGAAFHDLIPLYLQHYQQPPSPQWTNECRGITQDLEGHLWFGFDYIIRFDGKSFHRYEEKEGFPQALISYVLGQDHTGKVWMGLPRSRDTLYCYTNGAFQSVQVDLVGALRKIQCDREGRGWFCTTQGVLYQDGDGFSRFTPTDGLPHPTVRAVFHDREDRFWFATPDGVGVYDAHSISVFNLNAKHPDNPGEVSQMVQDRQGDIWIGYASPNLYPSKRRVGRLKGDHLVLVETEHGYDIGNCFAIYADLDGDLWFGSHKGLFRYNGQKLEKIEPIAGLSGKSVSAIAQDREGQFLFGYWENRPRTNKELYTNPLKIVYQRGEQLQTIFVENERKDPFSRIGTVIAGRNGEVWFHLICPYFSSRGLARWHPDDGLTFYGIADELIDSRVTDLLLDRHENLWIATANGLSHFDGSTFRTFTTEDGLPSNYICCLFEDRRGHLWLGTHGGVVHYDGRLFQTINSPHIGLVCRILEDRDGTFWFGTVLGSVIRYRLRQTPPRIRLLQVIADQVYEDPAEEVILSTTDQQVIFEYKGLSFSTPSNDMLYICRLQGHDPDWQPATRDRQAYYRDLSPGDYTFQVKAVDRDLNYSKIAQVRLSVEPDPRIEALTSALNSQGGQKFIGQSTALHQFQILLRKVASTDLTVLLIGETGVGKGLAARMLHALSAYSDGPFIQVNCGALPESLLDSELFGHERGAFTSAVSRRLGKVELAKGGTLFLDEIGDMILETQARMLRLLEEGTFERIGGSQTLTVQARIVAATNRNLEAMVSAGDFREDLYYRFRTFPLHLPPLHKRREDIPLLAEFFKGRMAAHLDKQIGALTPEIIEALQTYHWPGNVRELEHTMQRAVTICQDARIKVEELGLDEYGARISGTTLPLKRHPLPASSDHEIESLDEFERRYILAVLEATHWQIKGVGGAAALLGLPPSTLYTRMKKLGIKRACP